MRFDDKKLIHLRVPDYKNNLNQWVRHKSVTTPTERYFYTTYSANLYYALKNRCGGSEYQSKRYVLYKNFIFGFEDFQHLAEWNNSQEAWGNRNENGKLWSLDKDILVKGNRIYSPEFCCFVPEYVNNAFILNTNVGDLPLGVIEMSGRSKRYRVRQNNGKERKTITDENGRNFLCPYEAHTFWQYEKYKHLNTLAMRYISEKGSRKDVYEAICNRAQDILDQRNKGEITTFI